MIALKPGTMIAGRYKVVRELGRGGMGIVHVVEHINTGELLALKMLGGIARFDPQAVVRLKREARASAQIRSDHVVRVTDADTAPELENSPFIVMELLDGVDLEKHVANHGPMSAEMVVSVFAQIAPALGTAHRIGIIHRDLKPENIFLHTRPDGIRVAKVLDFGISKRVSAESVIEAAGVTSTGSVVGTPLYMAPEQAFGENDKIGPWTDIWAIGLVVLRLLSGEHFWNPTSMADLMTKLVVKPILPPSERWPGADFVSPALNEWFLRSCAREPDTRWTSVEEQVERLSVVLGVTPRSVIPASGGAVIAPERRAASDAMLSDIVLANTSPAPQLEQSADIAPLARSSSGRPRANRSLVPYVVVGGVLLVGASAFALLGGHKKDGSRPTDVASSEPHTMPSESNTTPPAAPTPLPSAVVAPEPASATIEPAAPTPTPSATARKPLAPVPTVVARPSAAHASANVPPPVASEKPKDPPTPSVDLYNRRK